MQMSGFSPLSDLFSAAGLDGLLGRVGERLFHDESHLPLGRDRAQAVQHLLESGQAAKPASLSSGPCSLRDLVVVLRTDESQALATLGTLGTRSRSRTGCSTETTRSAGIWKTT